MANSKIAGVKVELPAITLLAGDARIGVDD